MAPALNLLRLLLFPNPMAQIPVETARRKSREKSSFNATAFPTAPAESNEDSGAQQRKATESKSEATESKSEGISMHENSTRL